MTMLFFDSVDKFVNHLSLEEVQEVLIACFEHLDDERDYQDVGVWFFSELALRVNNKFSRIIEAEILLKNREIRPDEN